MNETRWKECGLCSFKSLEMGDFHRHLEDQHGTEVLFRAFESERTMSDTKTPMNAPTAIGILLICLAVIAIIPWGFGADRFLWIAAGTVGTGIILTTVGALTQRA